MRSAKLVQQPRRIALSEFRVRWRVLIPLIVLHIGAVAAFFFVTAEALIWAAALWLITGLFGVTVGYHRLLTHRSFETYPIVKYFHVACASISLQQGPLSWVRIHRAHHAYSDSDKDPHPQHLGIFFGHMGWTFLAHKEIGRSAIVKNPPNDLLKDPVLRFFERYHYPLFLVSLVFFYLVGGLPLLLWAGCFRTVFVLHITWSVNSIGHRLGTRRFETFDLSTNESIVGLLAWGEGWHNNHHKFPNSARQGLAWYEIDLSWYWIKLLERLGLAWNLKTPASLAPPAFGPASTTYSNPAT